MMNETERNALRRLRKMGLTKNGAEAWLADEKLRDAPLVRSVVIHDPTPRPKRVQFGRFQVERL
jgi:hypothetical protein